MLIRQLEYLVALTREGHFGRAAAACWVSQPTLSAGIGRLESDLGVALVRRGQRYEGLTDEGERLVTWARRMLHERDEVVAGLNIGPGHLSGRLRIGAIPTTLPPLPRIIEAYAARHPEVTVEVRSMTSAEIRRGLEAFELDVGITYLSSAKAPGIRALPMFTESYLVLTATGPDEESISWADASRLRLCLLTTDMQNRRIIDARFAAEGVEAAPHVETNSMSVLFGLIRTGRWSSLVPRSWLQLFGLPLGVRALRLTGEPLLSPIGAMVVDSDPLPAAADAFVRLLGPAGV